MRMNFYLLLNHLFTIINLFQIKECKLFQVTKRIKYKSAEKMHNPRFFLQ